MNELIWVFCRASAQFPSAVFSSREKAESWITKNKLSGTLTVYPLDIPIYDWAIDKKHFVPREDGHKSPQFIQRFSSAYQEHYHYEDGIS